MMKVKGVTMVYGCTNEALEEEYYVVGDGSYGCESIEYHQPMGEGDRHYVDVVIKDTVIRLFNPTKIEFIKEVD